MQIENSMNTQEIIEILVKKERSEFLVLISQP